MARECDLLLSTSLQLLRKSHADLDAITGALRSTWPAAEIDPTRVRLALDAGTRAGFIVAVDGLTDTYAITGAGADEADSAREWASEQIDLMASEIRRRVEPLLEPLSAEDARQWIALLAETIEEGVRHSIDVYQGQVDATPGGFVLPRKYDHRRMQDKVASLPLSSEAKEVLTALAFDAIDRSHAFGNALVSHITTGLVLQAFVSRRDNLRARELLGSLRDRIVVLDTMLLLRSLAPPELSRPLWSLFAAAASQGLSVHAMAHTFDEMDELVDANNDDAAGVERNLRDGLPLDPVATFVTVEPIKYWLQGREAGVYSGWESFRQAASGLPARLAAAGVVVRGRTTAPHAVIQRFREALTQELTSPGGHVGRRNLAIQRDAISIAEIYERRQDSPVDQRTWPAGWIVSLDRHLGAAYGIVIGNDLTPLTIAPSQWAGLMATFAEPAALPALAESASSLLMDETLISVTGSVDVSEALEIARMLAPDSADSPLEARVDQLTIGGALDAIYGQTMEPGVNQTVVGRVSAIRARRARRQRSDSIRLRDERQRKTASERDTARAELEAQRRYQVAHEEELRVASEAQRQEAQKTGEILGRRAAYINLAIFAVVMIGILGPTALGRLGVQAGPLVVALSMAGSIVVSGLLWRDSRRYVADVSVRRSTVIQAIVLEIAILVGSSIVSSLLSATR